MSEKGFHAGTRASFSLPQKRQTPTPEDANKSLDFHSLRFFFPIETLETP